MMTRKSLAGRAAGAVLSLIAVLSLGSCYLPIRFDAEVQVDRRGFYSMIFDGYVAYVPLYQDIVQKKVIPGSAEEKRRVANIKTDITRDSEVTEFTYYKEGIFKVHWERKGDLLQVGMVTFIRRNNAIVSLKYVKTSGLITLSAGGLSQVQRKQVLDAGLNVTGQLRLYTDARVGAQNASFVKDAPERGPGMKLYVWDLKSVMDPSPHLVLTPG